MRRLRFAALAAVALLAVTGCARNVELNPQSGEAYAVNVVNEMPHAMVVSYSDGQTTRTLGTVGANRQERFVVAGAAAATVTFIATDEADTHTVRRTVTLLPGDVVTVRIN